MDKFNKIKQLVGKTPMIEYSPNIYVKFEVYNPTGSIKDRIVFYIIEKFIDTILKNKPTIIEASSGSTGIAVAFASSLLGCPCKIIMPNNMSIERKNMIKMFGAELIEVSAGDFEGAIQLRNQLANENKDTFFNINQFHNPLNIQCHYNTTANEIVEYFQQNPHLTFPDTIISGVGTGGTIMGVSKRLREINPNLKVVIIEPAESNVFSGGKRGKHKIQGIGDGNTYLLDMDIVDEIIEIKSEDAVSRCKKMYREGFYVGISSAAYILAAEDYLSRNPDAHIITFMCDTGSKYMSII